MQLSMLYIEDIRLNFIRHNIREPNAIVFGPLSYIDFCKLVEIQSGIEVGQLSEYRGMRVIVDLFSKDQYSVEVARIHKNDGEEQ